MTKLEREERKALREILTVICIAFSVVLIALFFMNAALVQERSGDKLRLTVHADDMLASTQAIQGACRCLVKAKPIGGEEEDEAKYWLLEFATE
jgi:hypothetical protein